SYASGSPFSTSVIARASARGSPPRIASTRVSRVQSRRRATGGDSSVPEHAGRHAAAEDERSRSAVDPARAVILGERPAESEREPEDRVVEADDHAEHTAADAIRRVLLDDHDRQ